MDRTISLMRLREENHRYEYELLIEHMQTASCHKGARLKFSASYFKTFQCLFFRVMVLIGRDRIVRTEINETSESSKYDRSRC